MKIYFAGSIRAGRQDQQLYFQIVEMLKRYGKVLTEHVAAPDCNATFESNSGQKIPSITKEKDRMIFDTDMAWLKESDSVSAMINGAPNVREIIDYESADQLTPFFEKYLK